MDDLEELLAQATRGPWWFDNNDGYGPAAVHAAHKTNPHAYEVVAQAVGDSAEAEANSRLIAMAPELAEALIKAKEVLEWIASYPAGHPSYPQAVAALANDALTEIKKLGGE